MRDYRDDLAYIMCLSNRFEDLFYSNTRMKKADLMATSFSSIYGEVGIGRLLRLAN